MDPSPNTSHDDTPVPVTERVSSARTRRYLVAAALLGGGVTIGALFSPIGLAGAQSDDTTTSGADSSDTTTDTTTADGSSTTTDDTDSSDSSDSSDDGGHHGRGHGGRGLDELATTLGLTVDELRTEIEAGKSLADIAEAQGVSEDTVVAALVAHLKEHLDEAVADGRLEQAEADTKLADAETEIRDHLDDVPAFPGRGPGGPGGHGPGAGFGGMGEIRELADSLGLDLDALRTAVAGGQTVAEAAAAQGVTAEELKAALVTAATEHIDEALADGRIDQARADELKADLETRIDDLLNGSLADFGRGGPGGFGPGGHGHGPGGGGHGFGHGRDGKTTDDGSDGTTGSDTGDTQQSSYTA